MDDASEVSGALAVCRLESAEQGMEKITRRPGPGRCVRCGTQDFPDARPITNIPQPGLSVWQGLDRGRYPLPAMGIVGTRLDPAHHSFRRRYRN